MELERKLWAVKHTLDRLTLDVQWDHDGVATLVARGGSRGRRTSLWTHQETFGLAQSDLSLSDAVAHLAMVVAQDRPTTCEALQLGLRGGVSWSDEELPFS